MYTWLTYTTHFLPSIRSSFVFDDTHTPRFSFHLFQFLLPDESFAKARVFHVVLRCMESERERETEDLRVDVFEQLKSDPCRSRNEDRDACSTLLHRGLPSCQLPAGLAK